jgi:purine-cytosine permease-like protein
MKKGFIISCVIAVIGGIWTMYQGRNIGVAIAVIGGILFVSLIFLFFILTIHQNISRNRPAKNDPQKPKSD